MPFYCLVSTLTDVFPFSGGVILPSTTVTKGLKEMKVTIRTKQVLQMLADLSSGVQQHGRLHESLSQGYSDHPSEGEKKNQTRALESTCRSHQ